MPPGLCRTPENLRMESTKFQKLQRVDAWNLVIAWSYDAPGSVAGHAFRYSYGGVGAAIAGDPIRGT